jgi:hypothetical protein
MKTSGLILGAALCVAVMNQPAAAETEPKNAAAVLPADASAKKACANSTGQTKVECEKVAAKIDANTVEPRRGIERDELSSQDVRHSSTVVAKPDSKTATKPAQKEAAPTSPDKTDPKPQR